MSIQVGNMKLYDVEELSEMLDVGEMTIRRLSLIHISEPTRPY